MDLKHIRTPLLLFGLVILAAAIIVMLSQTFKREVPSGEAPAVPETLLPFSLKSSAFKENETIPTTYTCDGSNISPPLQIENSPANAKEFVLVMYDPDDEGKDKSHWIVWNIPPTTTSITENTLPNGSIVGTSDFTKTTYSGPCPVAGSGAHKYIFELYALNEKLQLAGEKTRDELIAAINGKVISSTRLTGKYEKLAQ